MEEHEKLLDGYIRSVISGLSSFDRKQFSAAAEALVSAYNRGATVYVAGNGGSGATSSHISYDFNMGTAMGSGTFRVISLCDNITTLLAISNDYGYENVFCKQLENVIVPGDILICLSGSGNSENVIRAAKLAKSKGSEVIAFTGYDGGRLRGIADYPVHVEIHDMQQAEDIHHILMHALSRSVAAKVKAGR